MSVTASAVPARRKGGIATARSRVDAYGEPKTAPRVRAAEQPAPEAAPAGSGWFWPDHLNATVLPELPHVGGAQSDPPPVTPASSTAAQPPADLLRSTVIFLGPRPDKSAAAEKLTAMGALVVEVPSDPTTAQGAEIIGAGAALARQLT